jgi:hypothetical protein
MRWDLDNEPRGRTGPLRLGVSLLLTSASVNTVHLHIAFFFARAIAANTMRDRLLFPSRVGGASCSFGFVFPSSLSGSRFRFLHGPNV